MSEAQCIPEPKRVWEVFSVGMSFGQNLEDGESVSSSLSEVAVYSIDKDSGSEIDVSDSVLLNGFQVSGVDMLTVVLTNGLADTQYRIEFKAYISPTKRLQEDLYFSVKK